MNPAPPLDCHACGRRIGKHAEHYLMDDQRVLCVGCLRQHSRHARDYPDCPHGWHDNFDHLDSSGTRAGVAAVLGLWPDDQEVSR